MTTWANIPGLSVSSGHLYLMGYDYSRAGLSVWLSSKAHERDLYLGYKMKFGTVALFLVEEDPIDSLGSEKPKVTIGYAQASDLLDRVRSDHIAAFGADHSRYGEMPSFHVVLLAREFRLQVVCNRLPEVSMNEFPNEPLFPQFVLARL